MKFAARQVRCLTLLSDENWLHSMRDLGVAPELQDAQFLLTEVAVLWIHIRFFLLENVRIETTSANDNRSRIQALCTYQQPSIITSRMAAKSAQAITANL